VDDLLRQRVLSRPSTPLSVVVDDRNLIAGLAQRPVPRAWRPRKAPAQRVTVFHGTSLDRGDAIAKHGLRSSVLGDGPWVTDDREHARGYVMRAVVAELDEQGRLDDPSPAVGLIVALRADPAVLVSDHLHEFELPGGCRPEDILGLERVDVQAEIEAMPLRARRLFAAVYRMDCGARGAPPAG
jgi:hypothetical protein